MGQTADSIEREILIEAPQQRVWNLITQPEHLDKWWAPGAQIDLRVGGAMEIGSRKQKSKKIQGLIEEVDEPHAFAVRLAPFDPGASVEPGNSTLIQFTLQAEGDATRLNIVESGFSELDYGDARIQEFYGMSVNAWGEVLDSLQKQAEGVTA